MRKNYFLKCMTRYGGYFAAALVLSYGLAAIIVRGNTVISEAVDTMLAGQTVYFRTFIVYFLVLTLAGLLAAFIKSILLSRFSIKVQTRYKNLAAEKMFRLEYKYFDENGSASVINKMNSDIARTDTLLNETLPGICTQVVEIITYSVYIGQLNYRLLILLFLCYPLILYFTNRIAERITGLTRQFRQKSDTILETAQDSIGGIIVLRAFGAENYFQEKMKQAANELVRNEEKRVKISNTVIVISSMLQWLPEVIYAVYAFMLVGRGVLSIGELMASFIILERFINAFMELPFSIVEVKESAVSIRRMEKILCEPEEAGGTEKNGPDEKTAVAFRHVSFEYTRENPVLKDVSFSVEKGRSVAFVGESGGGKSTIFHILCGFYPVKSGEYCLFGRNFKEWDIQAAREYMALVSQNVFLFPGTIYENVRYGNQNAGKEEIIAACKNAGIHEFIISLPEGYDTVVGERGILLSGGERQRISIARAFLKDAPILLLDEPTSAVDVETESLIQEAIDALSQNRTCITIAHRLSTIRKADEIMVLKDGVIAEKGTHEELMKKKGVYAGMYGADTERRGAERKEEGKL